MSERLTEQRRIVAYLDSVQARLASLPARAFGRLQSQTQDELPPSLRYGDASRDALSSSPSVVSGIPTVLDRAFKGEL